MIVKYITALVLTSCGICANSQALADALGKKDTVLAAQILNKGYNLDSVDQYGSSLLMTNCRYGDDTLIAAFLLRNGAKADYSRSPKGGQHLLLPVLIMVVCRCAGYC